MEIFSFVAHLLQISSRPPSLFISLAAPSSASSPSISRPPVLDPSSLPRLPVPLPAMELGPSSDSCAAPGCFSPACRGCAVPVCAAHCSASIPLCSPWSSLLPGVSCRTRCIPARSSLCTAQIQPSRAEFGLCLSLCLSSVLPAMAHTLVASARARPARVPGRRVLSSLAPCVRFFSLSSPRCRTLKPSARCSRPLPCLRILLPARTLLSLTRVCSSSPSRRSSLPSSFSALPLVQHRLLLLVDATLPSFDAAP